MVINADCTIYHKLFNTTTRQYEYIRFYFPQCYWNDKQGINRNSLGLESADSTDVYIWDVENFVKPKAYAQLADKAGKWTIDVDDKIVKGNIPDADITDLEKTYDDVRNVNAVDDARYGSRDMWHIEVVGK